MKKLGILLMSIGILLCAFEIYVLIVAFAIESKESFFNLIGTIIIPTLGIMFIIIGIFLIRINKLQKMKIEYIKWEEIYKIEKLSKKNKYITLTFGIIFGVLGFLGLFGILFALFGFLGLFELIKSGLGLFGIQGETIFVQILLGCPIFSYGIMKYFEIKEAETIISKRNIILANDNK